MAHTNEEGMYYLIKYIRILKKKRDAALISGSERSPGEGNGNPLQCSCLGNPMHRGDWWATVRGVAKKWTRLK